ncbi:MAG TPA: hypothetical protein VKV06_13745 [Acidimicrobiales bacterium]|nr:hypothetical protein [Acidimicrobiales bacterium]
MRAPANAPDWLEVFTAAERPDLWEATRGAFLGVWPEYNLHGDHTGSYFSALIPDYAHLQVVFVDRRSGQAVARGRTIAFRWDGSLADLPAGIDSVGARALEHPGEATALSALAAEVDLGYQGCGLSGLLLQSMIAVAGDAGLRALVAPVRPSGKHRYPLTPIERYAAWRRDDGLPFDPWMRVHARAGGRILRPQPESLRITAPVADWEGWTEMPFPEDGRYVFPAGLAPLEVTDGTGRYWEPNVWYLHRVDD